MVDQDPALVIDDQKFEPARQHRLAPGQHHLPTECYDVAALAGGPGGAIANAVPAAVLFGRDKGQPCEPAESAGAPLLAERVGCPKRGDGGERLVASVSFHAAT